VKAGLVFLLIGLVMVALAAAAFRLSKRSQRRF
jgi:hypothetical protein